MINSIIFQDQTDVPVGTSVGLTELDGEQLIRVVKPEENTEPDVATYARLVGPDFHDGTIEVDVRARLMHWADIDCRGFIGIVFRAADDSDRFESFYVRPRNGRSCTEPQRRIHTMQYFSYPGYTFAYFRERVDPHKGRGRGCRCQVLRRRHGDSSAGRARDVRRCRPARLRGPLRGQRHAGPLQEPQGHLYRLTTIKSSQSPSL